MADFTKGEWKVVKKGKAHSLFFDGFMLSVNSEKLLIALCDRDKWDHKGERLANAHLIAAAPEMYKALAHANIVLYNLKTSQLGELTQQQELLYLEVQKVLAKAEGRD